MTYACDYSWARPNPAAIKAAGIDVVCRYLSHDKTGKTLTRPEVDALLAAGLTIVLNFEDSAGRAKGGFAAGVADANFANDLADQLGAPANLPIYYSCDTDCGAGPEPWARAYADGLKSVKRRPAGGYGGAPFVNLFDWKWQSNARSWDHGQACSPHMHQLYGHPAGTPSIGGAAPNAWDVSVVNAPPGAWGGASGQPDNHHEVAPHAPTGAPIVQVGSRGNVVKWLQALLVNHGYRIAVDGIFGAGTKAAVVDYQRKHGLQVDGIVGHNTWDSLSKPTAPAPQPVLTHGAPPPLLKQGSRGDAVKLVQQLLVNHGFRIGVDGIWGPNTTQAVRQFQATRHIGVDGICGPNTWRELLK